MTGPRPAVGQPGPWCWSVTRPTRCARIWARAAVKALEDAAVLGAMVELSADLPSAFSAFESFRRARVSGVVRESRTIGRLVNLRPTLLSAAISRATVLVPEVVMTRHLATIAGRSAFRLPGQ